MAADDIADKKALRRRARSVRDAIDPDRRRKWSRLIAERVMSSIWYSGAESILLYYSYASEVETHELVELLIREGRRVYLPNTSGGVMTFHRVGSVETDLRPGAYGILEPSEKLPEYCSVYDEGHSGISLALVPGLLFDREGWRLGYGGGYYDRFLAERSEVVPVGLAYSVQVSGESIEDYMEPTDVRMAGIIYEEGSYERGDT